MALSGIAFFRMVLGYPALVFTAILSWFVRFGHEEGTPVKGWRLKILRPIYSMTCWLCMILAAGYRVNKVDASDYDYSYYLGPDYKKTQQLPKQVSTIIMNHQHWADNLIAVMLAFPSVVGKVEAKSVPFLYSIIAPLNCLFIQRQGSQEHRDATV